MKSLHLINTWTKWKLGPIKIMDLIKSLDLIRTWDKWKLEPNKKSEPKKLSWKKPLLSVIKVPVWISPCIFLTRKWQSEILFDCFPCIGGGICKNQTLAKTHQRGPACSWGQQGGVCRGQLFFCSSHISASRVRSEHDISKVWSRTVNIQSKNKEPK